MSEGKPRLQGDDLEAWDRNVEREIEMIRRHRDELLEDPRLREGERRRVERQGCDSRLHEIASLWRGSAGAGGIRSRRRLCLLSTSRDRADNRLATLAQTLDRVSLAIRDRPRPDKPPILLRQTEATAHGECNSRPSASAARPSVLLPPGGVG